MALDHIVHYFEQNSSFNNSIGFICKININHFETVTLQITFAKCLSGNMANNG